MKRHQKEFQQYLEDWKKHDRPWELWEVRWRINWQWTGWRDMESPHSSLFGKNFVDFRRKPDTIKIGDYDLPKPITEEPIPGQTIWGFTPECAGGMRKISYYHHDSFHYAMLQNGSLFKKEEHALEWVKWWKETVIDKLHSEPRRWKPSVIIGKRNEDWH